MWFFEGDLRLIFWKCLTKVKRGVTLIFLFKGEGLSLIFFFGADESEKIKSRYQKGEKSVTNLERTRAPEKFHCYLEKSHRYIEKLHLYLKKLADLKKYTSII